MKTPYVSLALALAAALALLLSPIHAQEKDAVKKDKDEPKKVETKKDDVKEDTQPDPTIEFKDELKDSDPRDKVQTESAAKIHIVKLTKGKTYRIDLKRVGDTKMDPYLRIEDSKGLQLAADDDSGGDLNSQITFVPTKTDEYRLVATCLFGTGKYTLTVTNIIQPKVKAVVAGKVLEVGKGGLTINDNLAGTDGRDDQRQGSFCKVFQVKLVKGKTYTFDMISNQIDSFLRIEDQNKNQLAFDDDSGGFPNARIVFRANEDAVYRIIGTSFGPNEMGAFTITIRE